MQFSSDMKIGDDTNHIVVDFGALGRLPGGATHSTSGTSAAKPDVPLPADSDGCLAPSSEAVLRYWCQGKIACHVRIDLLSQLEPESCLFPSGRNVSMRVYLRYRQRRPGSVSSCGRGATYHAPTQTCYALTESPGDWNGQRARCRSAGGDLAYLPSNTTYPGLAEFLLEQVAAAGDSVPAVWVAGTSAEPRPVLDMRPSAVQDQANFCLETATGALTGCSSGVELPAVCALPPWPEEVTPDCPRVTFAKYGLAFPETAPGQTTSEPCGAGYTGTARYTCGRDGQWSTALPDLTRCYSDSIDTEDVRERLENGTEPVASIVSELAANVSQRTSQDQQLTAGDIISLVQLLPLMVLTQQAQLTDQHQEDRQTVRQYVGNVTHLVGALTEPGASESWQTMPATNRSRTASTLQVNMAQSARLLADLLRDTDEIFVDLGQEAIRVQVGRYSSLDGRLQYEARDGSTLTLPEEVAKYSLDSNTSLVFVEYPALGCLLSGHPCRTADQWRLQKELDYPNFVNSPVLSANVDNISIVFDHSNVTLHFRNLLSHDQFNLTGVRCAFWNTSEDRWSENGCSVGPRGDDSVICYCNHLTSFATLMDINGIIEEGSALDLALGWLTTVGCVVSLLSLAACLVVFTAVPTLRSELISVHRNLCLSLFAAELILLVGLEPQGSAIGCAVVTALLHFWFLAAFAWMCIEGIQVYLLVYWVFSTRKSYMRYFYVCGYGTPALIVCITLSMTKGEGYGTETACWLSVETGVIWAFAGPALGVILVNIFALVLAIRVRARVPRQPPSAVSPGQAPSRRSFGTASGRAVNQAPSKRQLAANLVRGSASLVTILGTTWLFGFLYFSNASMFFSIIFTLLNSLQGFFIFLFLVWMNDKNRREAKLFIMKKLSQLGLVNPEPASGSSGQTSRLPGSGSESAASGTVIRALHAAYAGHYMNRRDEGGNPASPADLLILRHITSRPSDGSEA